MKKVVVILILLVSFIQGDDDYKLGEGKQIASLPIYIGGYFSIDYKSKDDVDTYRVDDIAFLSYGNYNKLSYVLELEFKEFYSHTKDHGESTIEKDNNLYIERAYVDYSFDENYKLRVGKYNSPIGFWNLLPVNVLRETTSNPESSSRIFPKFTTGANLSYASYSEGELKIDFMLQNNEDIDSNYNNYKMQEHYGLGVGYEKDDYAFKFNAGYFYKLSDASEIDSIRLYYSLLSAKYDSDKYQVLAELGSQKSSQEITTKYAGYIQSVYRFTEKHLGILRYESYDDKANNIKDEMAIVGYTYRPSYPIALKSEYQFHSLDQQNQLLLSLSVLF